MFKLRFLISILTLISLIYSFESLAQPGGKWKGSGGWGSGSGYNRMYDPKTVETILGEVVTLEKITPRDGMSYGVHLIVKTDGETISVHLGPGWFIERQDIMIEPKDKIEVTGSRITYQGKPVIIAAEVKKGDELLKLRDENGIPYWAGWRKNK
ncbi:MAG TPA: DNA-binding protein [Thermodesulfobacteriota bacterium]|jgi:hypothetical protein